MNIPRKLHQIWIGDKYVPPIDWMNTWRDHHPDWEYTLWSDDLIKNKSFYNQHLINEYINRGVYSGASDLIRYELLYEFGGFIPPSDSICLNNTDELFWTANIFGVYENENIRQGYVSPLYASIPKHPLLKIILEELHLKTPNNLGDPWDETGNAFLYYLLKQYTFSDLLIFPSHYFIPEHYSGEVYKGEDKIYAKQMWGSTTNSYVEIASNSKNVKPITNNNYKVSFIIPYATFNTNLKINLYKDWHPSNEVSILHSTINCINNINETFDCEKEIIIVDNTNSFPNISFQNTKIVKGYQYRDPSEVIKDFPKIDFENQPFENDTLWASIAYNVGLKHAKNKFVILQHNDIYYHYDFLPELINELNTNSYVSLDNKKIPLQTYFAEKDLFDKKLKKITASPYNGGYLKTDLGLSDAYFFLTTKDFFDDYYVDWKYGDTNHGATIKCLQKNLKYKHISPFYDNPNFKTKNESRDYYYKDKKIITHLKGGFSEHKMSIDYFKKDYEMFVKNFKR